jgi:hypothetical protein
MNSENYRIMKNSSGTKFKIQEKTYSWKNIFMNFLQTCFLGKGRFKEQFQWEDVYWIYTSLNDAVKEMKIMEQRDKDQDKSTWGVIHNDS